MELFYIGLSRLSTLNGGRQAALSAEGRRILRLLDRDDSIAIEPGGRPCFADNHADFSISHSRNIAAAAWLAAEGPPGSAHPRIGCDIQYAENRKRHAEISRGFFFPPEYDYIEAGGGAEGIRRFYRIWVLKEAALKMRGLSVLEMAKAPLFSIGVPRRGAARLGADGRNPLPLDCFLYELDSESAERYMLGVVRERGCSGETGEPQFRWFSETKLCVTRISDVYAF
jgi:hypothetical protein